ARRLATLGAGTLDLMPLAVGKLVSINGAEPRRLDLGERDNDERGGEIRLSWSDAPPAANTLVEGRWFDPQALAPQISVEQVWIERYGIRLGDRIVLRVAEREIEATVSSLRRVDWDAFRANFFLMLDPASGQDLPHGYIA